MSVRSGLGLVLTFIVEAVRALKNSIIGDVKELSLRLFIIKLSFNYAILNFIFSLRLSKKRGDSVRLTLIKPQAFFMQSRHY